jgi:glycerophosphoryl diester phosphodiesterase
MLKHFGFAMLLFCFIACSTHKNISGNMKFADNVVVAHRGAFKKNGFPENSIASLKEAIRLQCTGSEFDVRMTADDSLVVNHDPEYNKLEIEKTNYADLLPFKLSNGEKLPTLQEYIMAGLQNNNITRLIVEIKPSGISKERGKLIADKVAALVRQLKAEKMVAYISFDYDMLKHIHRIEPTAITQHLNGDISPKQLAKDGISGADYHFSVFKKNPGWIAEAKQYKLQLNAWTVNDPGDMDWLVKEGFDFITTNEPELLLDKLKK